MRCMRANSQVPQWRERCCLTSVPQALEPQTWSHSPASDWSEREGSEVRNKEGWGERERERHKGKKRNTQNNKKLTSSNRNFHSEFTSDEQKQLNQSEAWWINSAWWVIHSGVGRIRKTSLIKAKKPVVNIDVWWPPVNRWINNTIFSMKPNLMIN